MEARSTVFDNTRLERAARGGHVGRERAPQTSREKVDWLAVGDEKDLAGDSERICAGALEGCVGKLVNARATHDGLLRFVGPLKGSDDGVGILGTDVRS